MLANNIWELLGEFTETVLFIPYNFFRNNISGWWTSNVINIILILLGFMALFYWMGLMFKYKREGKEDIA
jgi:hypothetical protein